VGQLIHRTGLGIEYDTKGRLRPAPSAKSANFPGGGADLSASRLQISFKQRLAMIINSNKVLNMKMVAQGTH